MVFTLSMDACISRYSGPTLRTITNSAIPKTGIAIKKTTASWALMVKVSTSAVSSITGDRTIGRTPLLIAVCKIVTSLVSLVISEDVEK